MGILKRIVSFISRIKKGLESIADDMDEIQEGLEKISTPSDAFKDVSGFNGGFNDGGRQREEGKIYVDEAVSYIRRRDGVSTKQFGRQFNLKDLKAREKLEKIEWMGDIQEVERDVWK